MKKLLLIAATLFSTLNVFSQTDKGKVLISVDGNYTKSTTGNGVTRNQYTVHGSYLDAGVSAGYFISDRFIVGFGLDYGLTKEDRTNEIIVNRFSQLETMNLKSKSLLPNVYIGYYYQIVNKLYINTDLKFIYGKIKSDYNTLVAGSVYYSSSTLIELDDQYFSSYLFGQEQNSKTDFFSAKILPELSYFISPKFSFYLGFGGVEYSLVDWKNDNANWTISFNPTYWKFGLKIKV